MLCGKKQASSIITNNIVFPFKFLHCEGRWYQKSFTQMHPAATATPPPWDNWKNTDQYWAILPPPIHYYYVPLLLFQLVSIWSIHNLPPKLCISINSSHQQLQYPFLQNCCLVVGYTPTQNAIKMDDSVKQNRPLQKFFQTTVRKNEEESENSLLLWWRC